MGRTVTRDKKGRFVTATLDSDTAKEIGKLGHQVQKGVSRDLLLVQAGYDDPDKAPELYRLAAKQAVLTPAGMNVWLRLTQTSDTIAQPTAQPGQTCPTCRQYVMADLQVTDTDIDNVIDYLAQDKIQLHDSQGTDYTASENQVTPPVNNGYTDGENQD